MNGKSRERPNILMIFIDSMRADHLSCYGYQRKTTPHIDRLADEGCLFETCITAAPFSPSSYASVFSNLYPHQHGVNGDTVRIWPRDFVRLPEKLQSEGYFTFAVSNNAFVSRETKAAEGFATFIEMFRRTALARRYSGLIRRVRKYAGDGLANWLEPEHVRWPEMRRSARSMAIMRQIIEQCPRPFFGFAILMDPHAPYYYRRRQFCAHSPEVKRFLRKLNDGNTYSRLMANRAGLTDDNLRIAIDFYDAEIAHADRCIGELCDWLRMAKLLDATIVAVASDHGEAFGEHGVWGHGFSLGDAVTRVPLVVRCPRYWKPGTRSPALLQLHDVHDLFLSVAATGAPGAQGHPNCLTQASDENWQGRHAVYSQFPVQTGTLEMFQGLNPGFVPGKWGQGMWGIRTREWRYIEYDSGECELYDLVNDPQETRTVHDDHPTIVHELSARLAEHKTDEPFAAKTGTATEAEELDEVVLERLRALGYIE